jgi:hypothetical protein
MLRIIKSSSPIRGFDTPPSAKDPNFDTYLSRLIKLIPSEVFALYMVGRGILPPSEGKLWLLWTLIGLVAVIVVRSKATSNPEKRLGPQWKAVVISCVSYLIWLYSLGDVFAIYGLSFPYVGSLFVLSWTFFVPYFYEGD